MPFLPMRAGEFDRLRMLDKEKWEFVVDWLMQQHRRHLSAEVGEYQDAIKAIALHLYETFPKNLREVLKSDAVGEQAFKGMLLDLQRESVSILQQIQGDTSTILAQLQAMPTTEKMFAALAEVNSGIRSDLAEIKQILRQLMQGTAPISAPEKPKLRDAEGNLIPALGQTYNLPALPPKFLPRPEEIAEIKAKLLGDESQKLVVTGVSRRVGVQGMGGIGKSVLAAAVGHDEEVRRRFPDGVVWVTVGQTPDIVRRQQDLALALTGTRPYFEDAQQGKTELRQLLAEKACLLILDDVWQMPDAAGFDVLGANCQLLLTTRDTGLITGLGAQGHEVGLLSESQALGLLAQWAGEHPETLPPAARDVARECGYLPLAVAISGAMVCDKGANRWDNVLHKLQSADLEKLRQEFPDYPYPDLLKALQVSVEALDPPLAPPYQGGGIGVRYLDFAAFREDTPIPEAVLETFWAAAGLSPYEVQDVVDTLVQRSLAQRDAEGCITLHDLQFDYVRKQAGDISQVQERFLAAYRQRYPQGYHTVEDDGYFYRHLITHHLHQTNRISEIRELLLDFRWLQAKLDATDVKALLLDFEFAGEEEAIDGVSTRKAIALVKSAIFQSGHILVNDKTQLAGQLLGRLLSFVTPPSPPLPDYRYFWERIPLIGQYLPKYSQTKAAKATPAPAIVPEIEGLLTQAKQWQGKPWFRPLTQSLNPAGGALLRTLTGHSESVYAVAIAPDGKQAVSASRDKTLKLWDLATGTELATLTGHRDSVNAVAIAPNGKQAVSASYDKTLKLWDLATGTELVTLTRHSDSVWAVAITPDGKQAVSASDDKTLKLWDLATGEVVASFSADGALRCCAVAPDGVTVVAGEQSGRVHFLRLEGSLGAW